MLVPPMLLTVSKSGELACPTGCGENTTGTGFTLMAAGSTAMPESVTFCVRIASDTLRFPLMLPVVVGANTTLMAQLAWPVS